MTEGKGFPVLSAGDVVKGFPDLKAGDVCKVLSDALGEVDVGQFVVIEKVIRDGRENLSFAPADVEEAMSVNPQQVGTRVTRVEDDAVTLEVITALGDGPEG